MSLGSTASVSACSRRVRVCPDSCRDSGAGNSAAMYQNRPFPVTCCRLTSTHGGRGGAILAKDSIGSHQTPSVGEYNWVLAHQCSG